MDVNWVELFLKVTSTKQYHECHRRRARSRSQDHFQSSSESARRSLRWALLPKCLQNPQSSCPLTHSRRQSIVKSSWIQEDYRFNDIGVVTGKDAPNDRAHWICRSIALKHEAWNSRQEFKSRIELFVADPFHDRKGTVAKSISPSVLPLKWPYSLSRIKTAVLNPKFRVHVM